MAINVNVKRKPTPKPVKKAAAKKPAPKPKPQIGTAISYTKPKPAPTPKPSAPAPAASTPDPMDTFDQAAADALVALFDQYGLGSLAPLIAEYLKKGMSETAIVAQLRTTSQYKARFPGMDALRGQGYNAVSEAEYLQLEDSYHGALQGAGLPKGFYDDPGDFVKFISNGVDPSEVRNRAVAATTLANQIDPTQRNLLANMYGVNTGDIAAYLLDPDRAMPLIQKQLATVQVGSAAKHAGINANFSNAGHFERLVDNGVTADQASAGFSQIAQELDPLQHLAGIWGSDWSLEQAEDATFFGNAPALKKRKRIIDTERAAFSGASGFDPRVSAQSSTAGAF